MRTLVLPLLMIAVAAPALASDGILEIDQTCAVTTGCFAGDTPGFPVTIPSAGPRSFRLTSDLGPLGPNQSGIVVSANAATIDLGGFRIFGTTTCSAVPVVCTPVGSGVGVVGGSDVVVKHGTIHGMGDDGVRLDYSSRAESLHVFHNGGDGIELTNDGTATANHATSNGVDGIRCAVGCVVKDNAIAGNGAVGIEGGAGGVIQGNSVRNSGGIGISGTSGLGPGLMKPLALDNVLSGNGSISITGCAVRENIIVGGVFPFLYSSLDLGNNVCNNGGPCQ